MEPATHKTLPETSNPKPPLEGLELLAAVADAVFHGADASRIARKFSLPYAKAIQLRSEAFAEVFGRIEAARGREYMAQQKIKLEEDLEAGIAACRAEIDEVGGSRAAARLVPLVKELNAMRPGNRAPVQTEHYFQAQFQPEQIERAYKRSDVRDLLLQLEEKIGEEAAPGRDEIIDVDLVPEATR